MVGLNGNNLLASNLSADSASGSSYALNRPNAELSNELILSDLPGSNGSKFTSPALCCLVCGDSSSGKHYGIQVSSQLQKCSILFANL